ncbi:MAG: hypothetical protein J1F38_01175 [Muribaculaceae bacterium]|nr:hypothetical protein [Muribaculaceae bacterium]
MTIFIQIVILIVVLVCMVMVLLAIRQLTHFEGFDDPVETDNLKNEVNKDDHILSKNNIFSTLVEAEPVEIEEKEERGYPEKQNKSEL